MSTEKTMEKKTPVGAEMTKKMVLEYLRLHPEFFKENPELLLSLTPPEADYGNGVLDFQAFALAQLRNNIKGLEQKYDLVVTSARDNLSSQAQVHQAALSLVRARGLEQLLEVITQDMVTQFNVDVVRLAMESDVAGQYQTYYSEQNYSGIGFIETGLTDAVMGQKKTAFLCEDTSKTHIPGFERIFADCAGLVNSCALLRLHLPSLKRDVILAFGDRHRDRFHPGQGVELLSFLAQIIEHRLDLCLADTEITKVI